MLPQACLQSSLDCIGVLLQCKPDRKALPRDELLCQLQQGITYYMLQGLVEYKASSTSLAVIKYENDCLHCMLTSGEVQIH